MQSASDDASRVRHTERVIPRPWRGSDLPLSGVQNADPVVTRFLSGTLTRARNDAGVRAVAHVTQHGFTKWAVAAPGVALCVGAGRLTVSQPSHWPHKLLRHMPRHM
jgi:hypothetical protein